eukprot:5020783-Pyramimonas_sp.AAC.3
MWDLTGGDSIRTSWFLAAMTSESSFPFADAETANDVKRILSVCWRTRSIGCDVRPHSVLELAAAGLRTCETERS